MRIFLAYLKEMITEMLEFKVRFRIAVIFKDSYLMHFIAMHLYGVVCGCAVLHLLQMSCIYVSGILYKV